MSRSTSRLAKSPERFEDSGSAALPARWRRVLSLLVIWHFFAVAAFPFWFVTGPVVSPMQSPSPLAQSWLGLVDPYTDVLYLKQGHAFFAPIPPTSGALIRYELEMPDRETITRTFPDAERHWPRLYYHRLFMLSEKLAATYVGDQPPAEIGSQPEMRRLWGERRDEFRRTVKVFARHLLEAHDAKRVRLYLVRHTILSPADAVRGASARQSDPPPVFLGVFDREAP